ncbi:MAG: hypothetical protein ACLP8A_01050 [Methylovirgula sp.]
MSSILPETDPGLCPFNALLEEEYGAPLAKWRDCSAWSDRESLQISRAIGLLVKEPIAEVTARSAAEIAASETGGRRDWTLDDAKIQAPGWEGSWQWRLLADIDNAAKSAAGGMMTPSDPRLYLTSVRYERDVFALIAGHLLEFLCERPQFADCTDAPTILARLRQVPGLGAADPGFLGGLAFLIGKLGPKGFCAWCDERVAATDDDAL